MKLHKILFMNFAIAGTLITISSYSWMSMWMGLEINLLSIIPLFSDSKNVYSAESSMKYFITQALASTILLMAMLLMMLNELLLIPLVNNSFIIMMNSALMIKMGAAPFHFWFPEVIEGLNWMNSFILLTWQKIAPMMILMNNIIIPKMMIMIIIVSLMVSTINSFYQTSLRKILAFSSINHIAWMLSAMMVSFPIWLMYFIIYSLINSFIIYSFNYSKSFFINQLTFMKNKKIKNLMLLNFLSLSGLPPFLGFLPKWFVIKTMSFLSMWMLTFTLIIMTLIMMFVYIRMIIPLLTISCQTQKTPMSKPLKIKLINILNMMNLISLPASIMILSTI